MGNKLSSKRNIRDVTILVLGLDGAGKVALLQNLANEQTEENQISSNCFCSRRLTKNRVNICHLDVEDDPDINYGLWPKHFAKSNAIIYVVDSGNASRLEESKLQLKRVLMANRVACKPLLILSNKTEMRNLGNDTYMDVCKDLNNSFDLQDFLADSCRLRWTYHGIQPKWLRYALKKKSSNGQDKDTKKATKLLLETIANHWTTLAPRVESQKQKANVERIESRRMRNEEEDILEALVNNIEIASKSNNCNTGYDSESQQMKLNLTMNLDEEPEHKAQPVSINSTSVSESAEMIEHIMADLLYSVSQPQMAEDSLTEQSPITSCPLGTPISINEEDRVEVLIDDVEIVSNSNDKPDSEPAQSTKPNLPLNLDEEPESKGRTVLIIRVKSNELLKPQYISAVNIIQVSASDGHLSIPTIIQEQYTSESVDSQYNEQFPIRSSSNEEENRLEALVNNIEITSKFNNGNTGYDTELQQMTPNLTMNLDDEEPENKGLPVNINSVSKSAEMIVHIMADLLHSVSQPQLADVSLTEQSPTTSCPLGTPISINEEEDILKALVNVEIATKSDNDSRPDDAELQQMKPNYTMNLDKEQVNNGQPVRVKSVELVKHEASDFPMIAIAPLMVTGQLAQMKFEQQMNNYMYGIRLLESTSRLSVSMPVLNEMKMELLTDQLYSADANWQKSNQRIPNN